MKIKIFQTVDYEKKFTTLVPYLPHQQENDPTLIPYWYMVLKILDQGKENLKYRLKCQRFQHF